MPQLLKRISNTVDEAGRLDYDDRPVSIEEMESAAGVRLDRRKENLDRPSAVPVEHRRRRILVVFRALEIGSRCHGKLRAFDPRRRSSLLNNLLDNYSLETDGWGWPDFEKAGFWIERIAFSVQRTK